MNPYRVPGTPSHEKIVRWTSQKTLRGWIRTWFRGFLLAWHGTFKERYPISCPCGMRSWDPVALREGPLPFRMSAKQFSHRANLYRCRKRHDLRNRVQLG